ncbi:SusD/RagB family nutrient-binding outer membrane lipoprotein [Pseudochryseolinea flava]|uniref:SusD/RagB family nutrient-binding outer membrane lipoprotein n=1 Tax=Pseudochryseolinea flava TaxID=2059302 RepID=A0A364XZL2_9BACT|nr:SusD/RagB family nutrient-binding outer membrane lipoprotein [Pseudochryseolinea flava]RAV99824.1 SusD/RagB family nutrient-binding outer membrane lipoprotein [Pseudochryseolinea flava]
MRNKISSIFSKSIFVLVVIALVSCTSGFDDLNERPNAITPSSASPTGFIGTIERFTFSPDREVWWRAQLIHADRFADHFRFGFNGSWWNDGLGYEYNIDYTDWYWRDYFTRVPANINEYLKIVGEGGAQENENLYAIGLTLKALYYQLMTDSFGDIPYTQVADGVTLAPKYDEQKEIYRQSIADLATAISILGDKTSDVIYNDLLIKDDLIYGGKLDKWKKLANTLRLRMGLRALGAEGADFADAAIKASLAAPLLSDLTDLAKINKDVAQKGFLDDGYNNVWWTFGGLGSKWTVSKSMIDVLRDNNDPRLSKFAKPAAGGAIAFPKTDNAKFDKYYDFLKDQLDNAGVSYSEDITTAQNTITFAANQYYIGQPARLNGNIYSLVNANLFSMPSDYVTGNADRTIDMMPGWVMTPAESELLQAWAKLKGYNTSKTADEHYKAGITLSMAQFGVAGGDASDFIADEDIATLAGTTEQQVAQVATQLWVSHFGNGFEAWATVRKTGYPTSVSAVNNDIDIYYLGSLGENYPQRLRYSSNEAKLNTANVQDAVKRQGADAIATKVWWAKD